MLYNFSHRFCLPPLVDVTKVYSRFNTSKNISYFTNYVTPKDQKAKWF